jgi:hypothetical protein
MELLYMFRNTEHFKVKSYYKLYAQPERPPFVGCPPLIIQYIRIYIQYLEVISCIGNPRTRRAMVTGDPLNLHSICVSV